MVAVTIIIMAGILLMFVTGAGAKAAAVLQSKKLDHEYRMAQHKEAVEQNNHRRYRELEEAARVPSDLELQAQIAQANAFRAEHEAELTREQNMMFDRDHRY